DSASLPAMTGIKSLGIAAGDGIEHEQRPARVARLGLDGLQQSSADAATPGATMNLHLGDIGTVRLVIGHGQDELNCAYDGPGGGGLGHEHDALAARSAAESALPKLQSSGAEQRLHESDGSTALHTVDSHVGQSLGSRLVCRRP